MNAESETRHGTPNWADCATTDLDAAEKFYAAVFGWTSERVAESDGASYSLQRLDGKLAAGLYELSADMRRMNVPPHWATYIEVDDVDATLDRVVAEGGTPIGAPIDEPGVGKIAIIQDPVGAYLRIWRPRPHHGGEVFNVPGAMIWNELMTKEPAKATEFYQKVLGVQVETIDQPQPYTVLKVNGQPVAGVLTMTPEMGDLPAMWDVYFASEDVNLTTQKVIAAGGDAVRDPFDVAGVARLAVLRDPQGPVFEVMEMTSD